MDLIYVKIQTNINNIKAIKADIYINLHISQKKKFWTFIYFWVGAKKEKNQKNMPNSQKLNSQLIWKKKNEVMTNNENWCSHQLVTKK